MMKRSDIRNAFDQMNPTMQQKEKMHRAIMEAYVGKQGRYQAKPTVNRRWSWIPAAAALFAVILISVFVLPLSNNQIALTAFHFQSNTLQNLFHSGLYKANVEWAKYLDENENKIRNAMYSSENGIYNDFYCTDDIMRTALDKLCSKYGLVLSEESIILNDYDLLLDKLGISTTFKTATGVKYDMDGWVSAYCKDGTFCFGGTTAMTYEDSADSYSMHYVLTRVVMPVFHPNLLELANIPLCELQEYTTEDGVEVLLALGEDKSFLVTEVDDSVILVKLFRYDTADLVDAFEMNMEALTEFAETFDFQLIAQADSSPTVENMAYARETVNIYAEAQLESSIVGQFEQGTQRKILQRQNVNNINWLQIEEGWIKNDSVELRYVPEDDGYNPPAHEALLNVYRTAIEENWTAEECTDNGLSVRFADTEYAQANAAYVLLDIDGNGVEELIIGHGTSHYFFVWDLYAFDNNGKPVSLHSDKKDGENCHIYENGIIGMEFSGKTEGYNHYYVLHGSKLVRANLLSYKYNQWRDDSTNETMSREEAVAIMDQYDMQDIQFTHLFDYTSDIQANNETVEHYMLILEKYKTALLENWTWEQCDQADISRQIMFHTTNKNDLGWCLLDLDKNGVEELIISDGTNLFDLYTLTKQPDHILSAYPTRYTLCKNGTIECQEIFGLDSFWSWYNFSSTNLLVQDAMHYDAENHQYYYGTNPDYLVSISEDEAGKYLVNPEKNAKELTLTPFVEREFQEVREPNFYYESLIETYRTAIEEHWDPGKCVENGISLMVGYYGGLVTQLGHNQIDLNGDGSDELIITDGTNIYDLYTIINDEEVGPLRLIDATERSQYVLTTDGYIYNMASGSAMLSYYYLFDVGQKELVFKKGLKFDASVDPNNPWSYYEGSMDKAEDCTAAEAAAVIDAIHFADISFVPFE